MDSNTSQLFDGYLVVRCAIGRGGAGVVHEALDPDGARVAIKVLDRRAIEAKIAGRIGERRVGTGRDPAELARAAGRAYERHVQRFKEEYQTLINLHHPNIARVHRIGFHEGRFYIVSEFVDGRPIAEHVRGWKPLDMIPLFVQALSGLDCIHRNGLIHLDLKSENILVQGPPGAGQVKIIDFGLAMQPADYGGGFLGSVSTMSPEVALGLKEEVDARADLYSFGIVMYQCITWGHAPFIRPGKKDREAVRRAIEQEANLELCPPLQFHRGEEGKAAAFLDTIVMRLIAARPEERFYGNARAVINALTTHLPDLFQDTSVAQGSYLRPERGRLIGRDKDIELVEQGILDLAEDRQPSFPIIVITGEEGMGKTSLLKRLKETVDRNVEAISAHFLALPASDDAMKEKWANVSARLADNTKPVALFIDNLHELPPDSKAAAAIAGLARMIAERRLKPELYAELKPAMLLLTAAADVEWLAAALGGETDLPLRIDLKPFDAETVEAYLLSTPALRGRKIPPARVEALLRTTAGIPGEVVAVLDELDRGGVIFDANGEIVLAEIPHVLHEPPRSTRARLMAKYRALAPLERDIADLVACFCLKPFLPPPRPSDIQAIAAAGSSVQTLQVLVHKGILEHDESARTYAFLDGDAMPGLLHEEIGCEKREGIHSAIADHLERICGENDYAARYHRALGSDGAAALRHCILLARDFLYREGKCTTAIELLERAKELADPSRWKLRAYILSLLAEAYFYEGCAGPASQTIQEGLGLASGRSRPWEQAFRFKAVAHHLQTGKHDEAKKLIDDLKTTLKGRERSVASIVLLNYEAMYCYARAPLSPDRYAQFLDRAKDLYEQSERLERAISGLDPRRVTNNWFYLVLRSQGQLSPAAERLEQRIRERGLHVFALTSSYATLADICRMERKYEKALEWATKALAVADKAQSLRLTFHARGVFANIYHDMNRFDKSLEERNRQIAASACLGDAAEHREHSARIWTHMGHCYKELGNLDKAIVSFDAAIGGGKESDCLMSAYQGLGEVFFHKGEFERAFGSFAKAEELLATMPRNAVTDSHRYRIARLKIETFLMRKDLASARLLLPELELLAGGSAEREKECEEVKRRMAP